jgi:hypothetical protein
LIALCIFDLDKILRLKLNWIDAPMLIFCICPIFSSLTNGLGFRDGVTESLNQTLLWGTPYFLGRLYLDSLQALNKLSSWIFVGGIVYIPLCLFEVRMSPQLHRIVYGYGQHSFLQTIRYGGYRPTVFLSHGLEVGLWMAVAGLIGFCLWQTKSLKYLWSIPIGTLVVFLLFTNILVKSTGALILLFLGLFIFYFCRRIQSSIPLIVLLVSTSIYLLSSAFFEIDKSSLVDFVSHHVSIDRAESLNYRFHNEDLLTYKARHRLLFGWGGWGRNKVYQENWEGNLVDITVTDSRWIIIFGKNGIIGLVSHYSAFILPILFFTVRFNGATWHLQVVAPSAALAISVTLFMVDSLLNDSGIPVFPLAAGGLASVAMEQSCFLFPAQHLRTFR